MTVESFIIVAVCGLGVGVLSGMFGIGGGGMIVPLLNVAFGLPVLGATSTSLLTIALTGLSGAIKHLQQKTAQLKIGLVMGGFGALAAVVSSLYAERLPELAVVLLTVTVILFSVGSMVRSLIGGQKRAANSKGFAPASAPARQAAPAQAAMRQERTSLVPPLLIGLTGGAIAGVVGVGGGFIIVPFCVSYLGFSLREAAGTSLIAITVIAVPGIITHALLGHIWWLFGLALVVGTIPGAQLGAWLIARLPERPMRFAFCGLLTLMGALMLANQFVILR
ncbi:MAG: sulfite exporter TauE/SafE family protein [Coriobacteriales bacterium]|jgi:uncharacterized membrane protein YfcA|nr:sulfite exporter TauE/SafE family protein [Coriobacteriales bacterium]